MVFANLARRALNRSTHLVPATLAASLIVALVPGEARTQGWIDPVRPGMGSVERVESRVSVVVEGAIATVEVDEWFVNSGERVAEGHYLYPLPAGVALSGASLYQGETELRGEVMDADEARKIYEEIVRRMADPALVEYLGEGLFRARVFPIAPGERRRVTLRYSQLLTPAGQSLQFRTPGALRPTMATHGDGGKSRTAAPAPVDLTMRVTPASSFLEPFSPSHALDVDRHQDTLRIGVSAAEGRVSVFLPRSGDAVGLTVLPHRPAGDDGYLLLSLTPPATTTRSQARDVVVVVDVSGSMAGTKLEQARSAVEGLLAGLDDEDRYRLVAFSNSVNRLDTEWRRVDDRSLADARRWLGDLRADGGTNIAGALAAAFETAPGQERLPVVVFLTDGLPTVGERDPDRISNEAEGQRGRFRVFAFGVGNDVNTRLLDRLSEATRGTTQYVEPHEDVERAVSLLAARISQPVFTDVRVVESPVAISDWYPVHIPDVFAGESLILLARYRGEGEGRVVVEGRADGRVQRVTTTVRFPRLEQANAELPRLWAARKLGHLTRQLWTEGETADLVEEIRTTALRYGLPSPFTSLLVQEPDMIVADAALGPPRPAAPADQARRMSQAVAGGVGAPAVKVAERSRRFRAAGRTQELEALAELAAEGVPVDTRVLAGRVFHLQDGVWIEAGIDSMLPVVGVKPYGEAWFALVARLPALEATFRAGRIELAGDGLRLRIDDGGAEALSATDQRRVLVAFGAGD